MQPIYIELVFPDSAKPPSNFRPQPEKLRENVKNVTLHLP